MPESIQTSQQTERTLRSSSSKYNEGTKQKQELIEQCNSVENWHIIVEAFKSGRAKDVSDEPKVDKIPCFVLGSGASLDESLPHLKDWKGGIFCGTSQARALMYHGIEPTCIVCLDPFCRWEEIDGIDWSKTKTKLVVHPGVYPSLIKNWPNHMLFYIQDNARPDSWYNLQKKLFTWRDGDMRNPIFHYYIRTSFMIFACVPPMQMFVSEKLGYSNIFLSGMNWSEYKGKTRATEYTIENGEWIPHFNPYIEEEGTVISNNGRKSKEIHLYYKKNFMSAWRLSHRMIYNTDKEGIIPEVPYTDIRKVIQKQGKNYPTQSHEMIDRITERYLASVGAYVITTGQGVSFVESNNPTEELPAYMKGMQSRYKCEKCGSEAVANDEKDYTGDSCQICKEGKMKHSIDINIEKNMERINRLISLTEARSKIEEKKE